MKILNKNIKQGEIKILAESNDDLWFLSQIISPGDVISGKTQRKIKISDDSDPVKKVFFLKIGVEKIDFQPDLLRLSGKILEGPEDLSKGVYHTFNIEAGSSFTVKKDSWLNYHLKILDDSLKQRSKGVLICIFDREEAVFAVTNAVSFKILSKLKGSVSKKNLDNVVKGNFYEEIIKNLKDYDTRLEPFSIILASPSFWKDELVAFLKDDALKKKIVFASCAFVGESAVNEILKRDEVKSALFAERSRKELILVDDLLAEISKQGLAVYGFENVKNAVLCSAVVSLLVSTEFIKSCQEENSFDELNNLMVSVDRNRGEINIISGKSDAGIKLDGLGGIAALLRFKC
jgi:protein pelota